MNHILVTGAAGFIGSQLVTRLLGELCGATIVGLDSVNDYYDVRIKEYRLARLEELASESSSNKWVFVKGNIADKALIDKLFAEYEFDVVETDDITLDICLRVGDRVAHTCLCREVHDNIKLILGKELVNQRLIGNVALDMHAIFC